jgi:hypothetical protein
VKKLKGTLIAILLVPVVSGAVPPTALFTPLLTVAGNQLVCNVVNASQDTIVGSLIMIGPTAAPITPTIPFNLAPGEAAVVAGPFGFDGYCKISFVGKEDAVRANLCVAKLGEGCIATADAR